MKVCLGILIFSPYLVTKKGVARESFNYFRCYSLTLIKIVKFFLEFFIITFTVFLMYEIHKCLKRQIF